MSDRYDRGSRRGVWSHWVPLAITVTVATAGLAAWAWSQRKDDTDDTEHEPDLDYDYDNADYGDNPAYGVTRPGTDSRSDLGPTQRQQADPAQQQGQPPAQQNYGYGVAPPPGEGPESSWGARMSGALRRTPSPQQFLDSTGKTVAAGVAAAGAVVGKALASIREEDRAYGDSNPWSEEADAKKVRDPTTPGKKRKTVVVIVSADAQVADHGEDGYHEHASILSHIPRHNDFSNTKLFVLIYAPGMKDTALDTATSNLPPPSLSSSFSNIGHDQVQTPGEESKNPIAAPSAANSMFNAVYSQAMTIVEKESMILPFTTPNGHTHILPHLQPEVVYLQESLAGDNGSVITKLQAWLRYDVILIVGAETGSGGLADSESEAERSSKVEKWWQKPERVGRGRGVVVVDSVRVHDDWVRRVQGKD